MCELEPVERTEHVLDDSGSFVRRRQVLTCLPACQFMSWLTGWEVGRTATTAFVTGGAVVVVVAAGGGGLRSEKE